VPIRDEERPETSSKTIRCPKSKEGPVTWVVVRDGKDGNESCAHVVGRMRGRSEAKRGPT